MTFDIWGDIIYVSVIDIRILVYMAVEFEELYNVSESNLYINSLWGLEYFKACFFVFLESYR